MLDHFGIQEDIRVQSKSAQTVFASDTVLERLESDVRAVFPAFTRKSRAPEEWEDESYRYFKDEWGTSLRMPKQDGKYYDMFAFPLAGAGEEQDAAYPWPEPPGLQPVVLEQAQAYRAAGYPVILTENFANGFLQTGPKIFGFEDWLAILAAEERRARAILDELLARKMKYWDNVAAVMGTSLDIVCEMDDLGTQKGPFISPQMFRSVIKPYYRTLFPYIKEKTGARLFMHSCGSIAQLIPDLIEVGVDIVSPVQIGADGMEPCRAEAGVRQGRLFLGRRRRHPEDPVHRHSPRGARPGETHRRDLLEGRRVRVRSRAQHPGQRPGREHRRHVGSVPGRARLRAGGVGE